MKEINLKYKDWTQEESPRKYYLSSSHRTVPNLDMEELYISIIERVKNKEKVYVKFPNDHIKRPGAIALVNKITGDEFSSRSYQDVDDKKQIIYEDQESRLVFHLKWDDRKNRTKVNIRYDLSYRIDLFYLPDYKGPTIWSMFDKQKYIEKNAEKIVDRMGRELSVHDTVVYINARYGTGACLDFGVIREIKYKVYDGWNGKEIEPIVVIETVALEEGELTEISKIKSPENSVMRMTDIDLMDEAFVRKLTVTQKPV